MTLVDTPSATSRVFLTLSNFRHRHRSGSAIAHLDDRLRADVGLPPIGARPLLPREAAARAAILAWR